MAVSVKLSPLGNQQLVDESGNPAVGWYIETYAAGSSIRLATYTDETGTVTQSANVTMNALGLPETGKIWLIANRSYKFKLYNSAGVLKDTVDHITGVNDALANQWLPSNLAPTYINATTFTLSGDQTTDFHAQRKLQFTTTAGGVYGEIATSVYGTLTTVTMTMDGTSVLDSGLSAVNLSLLRADHLASPGGTGTFIQSGTSAVFRTPQNKMRESVSVKDFGAVLDNVVDDTAAFQAAALTGANILVPDGNAKITGAISFTAGQRIYGRGTGKSKITPVGNFDLFTWSGGTQGGGASKLFFDAGGMTGGRLIVNDTSDRAYFSDLLAMNPFNGFFVKKTNVVGFRDIWVYGIRGSYGMQLFGDATNRTDVVDIDNMQFSTATTATALSATGLLIDGAVNTVDIRHYAVVHCLRGIHIRNTSGGPDPSFLSGYDIQSDFPYAESIRVEGSCRSVFLTDLYTHGSLSADGVYIDSTVQNVSIQGAQIDSHFKRGIFVGGRYVKVSNANISTNSQAGAGTYPGVEIGAASIGVNLHGNMIGQWIGYATELQSYGVVIAAGAQTYNVTGNNLRNNVTGDYQDNAADATSIIFGNNQSVGTASRIIGPIQSTTGDLFLYGSTAANSAKLGNAANGTGFAAQASDALTVNFMKAFGHSTGSSPAIEAVGADANLDFTMAAKGTGQWQISNAGQFAANGVVATSLTGVGPTGSRTTVQKWLIIKDQSGSLFYIPLF